MTNRRGVRASGDGRWRVAVVLVLLGVSGFARRAGAYVRYRTTTTNSVFAWPQTWVPMSAYPGSMTDVNGGMDMTPEQIIHASEASAAAWSAEQNPCSFLVITVVDSAAATPIAKYDYKNSLVFRTTSWCSPSDKPGVCSYDPAALAITSVFANKSNGLIRDADIEVNSKNFIWADLALDPTAHGKQDLQNALTHEMGHLVGLDHTCYVSGDPPVDENGLAIPSCDGASEAVRATTMFASAVPGDVEKRTLAPDDKAAICAMYPVANDPHVYPTVTTPPPGTGGCAVAPGASGGAALLLGAIGALVAAARRRTRSRLT